MLTWIVFGNGDEVEEALAGQQLRHGRQEPVRYLSTSNPSGPGSLDASAAHLVETNNEHRQKTAPRFDVFDAALRYLLGRRDHVRRVEDQDVHLPLEPRQETVNLKQLTVNVMGT